MTISPEVLQKVSQLTNRRRVKPMDDETEELPSVQGTAEDMMPAPQETLGNFNPENYDARANQVVKQDTQEGFWEKIGKGLSEFLKPQPHMEPSGGTAYNDIQPENLYSKLGSLNKQEAQQSSPQNDNSSIPQDFYNQDKAQNLPYSPIAQNIPEEMPAPPQYNANSAVPEDFYGENNPEIAQSETPKEPLTYVETGASKEAYSNPTVASEIEKMFGKKPDMKEVTEMEDILKKYEQTLDGVDVKLTDRENSLMQKITNRDLTPGQQFAMALALIAPAAIAGLVAGKEGFLLGMGGGAKNIADILGRKEKEINEAEEALPGLAMDKANLQKEKLKTRSDLEEVKAKIGKSNPNSKIRERLEQPGNANIVDGQLVLESGNELLPIKASALKDEEDYKRIKKDLPKYEEMLTNVKQSEEIISSMRNLLDMSEKQKSGRNLAQNIAEGISPFNLYDIGTRALKAFQPWTRDTVKDENGNEIKIASLYSTYRTQLSDLYRKTQKGSNAFKATEQHFFEQLPDPYSVKGFLSGNSNLGQAKKQLDAVSKKLVDGSIDYLDQQGINTGRLKLRSKVNPEKTKENDEERKKKRAEEATEQALKGSK